MVAPPHEIGAPLQTPRALAFRRHAGPGLLAAALLLVAALSPRLVPFDMDEFSAYQPLGCHAYPLSERYHVYREACHLYDLRLPFTSRFLPLRSYRYIGSLPVAIFYPFWKLIRHPVSARVQGAVFFLLALVLTRRVMRAGWTATLLAALVFPVYVFAFLVDTGPAGLSVLLLLLALLGTRVVREGSSPGARLSAAAGTGAAVFLGAFVKPVFLWTLPALLLAWVWPLGSERPSAPSTPRRLEQAGALALFGLAVLLPGIVLASAVDRWGARYGEVISVGRVTLDPASLVTVARRLGRYFVDGTAIHPRSLELPRTVLDVAPLVLAVGLLAAALRAAPKGRRSVAVPLAMSGLVFAVTLVVERAWAPHHAVFAHVFLVLALVAALEKLRAHRPRLVAAAAVWVALYAASIGLRLPAATSKADANRAKDRLLALVRDQGLDARTVQVHVAWGTYYIAHLFGHPSQAVVYLDRFSSPASFRQIRRAARELDRTVLVIGSDGEEGVLAPGPIERFGTPVREYRFDNWWAREYAP